MKIIERVFDSITGETTDIERDMTAQEIADYEFTVAKAQEEQLAKTEAQAKKQALLDRLGITAEEARLLLS